MERVGTVVNSKETASSQMKTTPAPKPTKHSAPDKKINPETTRSQDVTPDSVLTALYPPVSTQLSFLEEPTKILIVHSILLIYVFGWVVALVMWGFAIVWLFFALASISRSKFPFNMGWWGFTFPLGVLTVSTTTIGKETGSRFFNVLGTVWEYRLSYTLSSAVLLPLVLISPPFTTIPSCWFSNGYWPLQGWFADLLDTFCLRHATLGYSRLWNVEETCNGRDTICALSQGCGGIEEGTRGATFWGESGVRANAYCMPTVTPFENKKTTLPQATASFPRTDIGRAIPRAL